MTYSVIYVIRSKEMPAHKIGVTNNWSQRQRQLEVGIKAEPVHVVRVHDAGKLESFLHRRFKAKRLPQSEWFLNLDSDELSFVHSTLLKAKDDYDRAKERQRTPAPTSVSNKPQPKWYADHLAAREREASRASRAGDYNADQGTAAAAERGHRPWKGAYATANGSPRPVLAKPAAPKQGNCFMANLCTALVWMAVGPMALYVLAMIALVCWPVLAAPAVILGFSWLMKPHSGAHT